MVKPWRHMPGPSTLPVIGSLLRYTRFGKFSFDRMHLSKKDGFETYGKIYKEHFGPATIVQLFDPVDISKVFRAEGKHPNRPTLPIMVAAIKRDKLKQGLGHSNGEEWYRLRKSVHKLMLSPQAAAVYLPVQNEVADDFVKLVMEIRSDEGEVEDVHYQLIKYTIEAFGSVCFNERLGVLSKSLKADSLGKRVHHAIGENFDATQKTTFSFPWYFFFKTKLYKQFIESKAVLDKIALDHIKALMKRMEHEDTGGLFLQTLLDSGLSLEDVICITTDLFTAGIDSTGNALSFVLYNLARSPEKQEQLHWHIQNALKKNEPVTPEALQKLSYLKACVKESFRLNFPTEGGTTRILEKDMELGGYLVPKGTTVAMNNQTMCLQNEWFDKEDEFHPERWLHTSNETDLRTPPPFVMMPFGYGPRMCIGRRFAEQEIFLAVIKLLQNFKLEYHGENIGMLNRIFTAPDKTLRLTFRERPAPKGN